MTEFTILAIDPTEGMTTKTVTAATEEEAVATLAEGTVVLTITTRTTI
jgi:hypothetical protein